MSDGGHSVWKVVGGRVVGPSHEATGTPCQDAFAVARFEQRVVVAVSDGAGSARLSHHGSKALCEAVVSALAQCSAPLFDGTDVPDAGWRDCIADTIERVRHDASSASARAGQPASAAPLASGPPAAFSAPPAVAPVAGVGNTGTSGVMGALGNAADSVADFLLADPEASDRPAWQADASTDDSPESPPDEATPLQGVDDAAVLDDFSATLVGFVAEPAGGFFFHLGDGVAVACHDVHDPLNCTISHPENGEYANQTYFFTSDDWRGHLRFKRFGPAKALMAMTDGAEGFVMAKRRRGLAPGFFEPVQKYLSAQDEPTGERALTGTLGKWTSEGDDKTLVWASLQGA